MKRQKLGSCNARGFFLIFFLFTSIFVRKVLLGLIDCAKCGRVLVSGSSEGVRMCVSVMARVRVCVCMCFR